MKEQNVVKISLEDMSITLKIKFGKKVIEVAKIMLKKKE